MKLKNTDGATVTEHAQKRLLQAFYRGTQMYVLGHDYGLKQSEVEELVRRNPPKALR